jgi:hypothetical protein
MTGEITQNDLGLTDVDIGGCGYGGEVPLRRCDATSSGYATCSDSHSRLALLVTL